MILVEGGPQLLADFYAQQVMDEQFLTLAPQIAGRDAVGAGRDRMSAERLVAGMGRRPACATWNRRWPGSLR